MAALSYRAGAPISRPRPRAYPGGHFRRVFGIGSQRQRATSKRLETLYKRIGIPTVITSTSVNIQPRTPHMNITELPDLRAAHAPPTPAIADDDTDLNNAQFADAVRRASSALGKSGIAARDVVAIKLPNPEPTSWWRRSRRGGSVPR